jgi:hypothetical protein
MLEKQMLLERAAPEMIERLANPFCRTAQGELTANPGQCPDGAQLEFEPVRDVHVGVITTSLGGHGGDLCLREDVSRNNDQAYLIPKVRSLEATADPDLTGFLSWNGGDEVERNKLEEAFTEHLQAVGDSGCGFEAPLEAWYRFLVDPQPPLEMVVDNTVASSTGVDQAVLTL